MENTQILKEEQDIINETSEEDIEMKFDKFINSVFKGPSKKIDIIKRLRPLFSLKVFTHKYVEAEYSSLEMIDPEKIDLIKVNEYKEEKYSHENKYNAELKSAGLSETDIDLSLTILGKKQSLNFDNKEENSTNIDSNSSKIHCVHSIIIKIFRIIIDFKDIKLSKKVTEDLQEVDKCNETDKKLLLKKLVENYGLYVPLEVTVGGRIKYSFEAKNEEDMKDIYTCLKRKINANFGGGNKLFSVSLKGNYNKNFDETNYSKTLNKAENLNLLIEGGDYTYKDNFGKWIQSFNIDNLQIIEYKSLQPIYCFIPGLESKLSICLQNYEDIVLKEIYNLMENNFAQKEKELFEGSSDENNFWKIGITQENYKGYYIYRKKLIKKLKYDINEIPDEESEENKTKNIKDVICGEIPEGFIICGWLLKTNANSNYYKVVANWKRKKEVGIIGNEYFKFKVDLTVGEDIDEDVEIEWSLDVFCIHNDFLISTNHFFIFSKYNHYFINCDCGNKDDCYYNYFYNNKYFIKKDKEDFKTKKKIGNPKNLFG